MDWKKHGVKIVHSGELDTNTPQTPGMTRLPPLRTHEKPDRPVPGFYAATAI